MTLRPIRPMSIKTIMTDKTMMPLTKRDVIISLNMFSETDALPQLIATPHDLYRPERRFRRWRGATLHS